MRLTRPLHVALRWRQVCRVALAPTHCLHVGRSLQLCSAELLGVPDPLGWPTPRVTVAGAARVLHTLTSRTLAPVERCRLPNTDNLCAGGGDSSSFWNPPTPCSNAPADDSFWCYFGFISKVLTWAASTSGGGGEGASSACSSVNELGRAVWFTAGPPTWPGWKCPPATVGVGPRG